MNNPSDDNRISELESRLEFIDDTISRLNEALVIQQQRYFELDKKFSLLVARLQEKNIDLMDPKDEPPPPHY